MSYFPYLIPCWIRESLLVLQIRRSAHCTKTIETKKAVWHVWVISLTSFLVELERAFLSYRSEDQPTAQWRWKQRKQCDMYESWPYLIPCWNRESLLVLQIRRSAHCTKTIETKKAVWHVWVISLTSFLVEIGRVFLSYRSEDQPTAQWQWKQRKQCDMYTPVFSSGSKSEIFIK